MTDRNRAPRGVRTGGRFAPGLRAEPTLTLPSGAADMYRRFTGDSMDTTERRNISRRLIQETHDSGMLLRMVGTRNAGSARNVLDAAEDPARLDEAIAAVIDQERSTPGALPPDSLGFRLCRQLLTGRVQRQAS